MIRLLQRRLRVPSVVLNPVTRHHRSRPVATVFAMHIHRPRRVLDERQHPRDFLRRRPPSPPNGMFVYKMELLSAAVASGVHRSFVVRRLIIIATPNCLSFATPAASGCAPRYKCPSILPKFRMPSVAGKPRSSVK